MGNKLSPCFQNPSKPSSPIKLIFYNGTTQFLTGKRIAGEIMFQYPTDIICNADSFFIGQPIPSLSIDDRLLEGNTYFVLPIDKFSSTVLSVSFLTSLNANANASVRPNKHINFRKPSFDYIKGANGRIWIKVVPEFLVSVLIKCNTSDNNKDENLMLLASDSTTNVLCSTPELKKHYDQLVGCKEQVWSPKLETISECKLRLSPLRFIGLEKLVE